MTRDMICPLRTTFGGGNICREKLCQWWLVSKQMCCMPYLCLQWFSQAGSDVNEEKKAREETENGSI